MVLSDAELRAIKILRREAAMWPRGRWMILVLSVGALLFGLLPWTRVILGADAPAETLRGVPSNMLLPVAVLWAEQSIATIVGAFGIFVIVRNWHGKPERTVLLAVVEHLLAPDGLADQRE